EAEDAFKIAAIEPIKSRCDLAVLAIEVGPADEPRQIAEAGFVCRHQHHAALAEMAALGVALLHPVFAAAEIERQLAAQKRLDALPRGLFGEFERAEQIIGVGDAKGWLFVIL